MFTQKLSVEYANGEFVEVLTDQRDRAAYELEFNSSALKGIQEGKELVWRYLAWNALRRMQKTTLMWPNWSNEAVAVDFVDDDEVDPGQPTAQDTSS